MLLFLENLRAASSQLAVSDSASGSDNVSVIVAGAVSILVGDSATGTDKLAVTIPMLGGLLPFQMRKWPKLGDKQPGEADTWQGAHDGALAKDSASIGVSASQHDVALADDDAKIAASGAWADRAVAVDLVAISIGAGASDTAESSDELSVQVMAGWNDEAQGNDFVMIDKRISAHVIQMQNMFIAGLL